MSDNLPFRPQPKKAFHQRNGSDELDVFEAARYFSGASESFTGTHKSVSDESRNFSHATQKHCMRPPGRMSLDMPKGNPTPLQAMLLENPIITNKEKKSKQPSSPGGKLAHFLNSLFSQTSSKKSKPSKTKSTKDEDESPSGWRRKRRSSISHFRSSNTSSATTIMHDSKSLFSTSSSSGYRTPPTYQEAHTPTKTASYRDHFKSYSYLKPAPSSQVTKAPIINNGSFNKIDNANTSFGNGFVEKVKMFDDQKQEEDHYRLPAYNNTQEFKRFIDEDDHGDSDSSSDLFELTNCDLGHNYCSNGLPVFETTHMHSIKRGAPISS